jgi:hypothetical protein
MLRRRGYMHHKDTILGFHCVAVPFR